MANKIVQRLIAAGASPQRAQAFATQFTESAPGVKTADLEDAFDEQLAELSKVYFPNVFRPPTLDDPRINDYVSFVYGPNTFTNLETKTYANQAPTFTKAKTSAVPIEKMFADAILAGQTYAGLEAGLQTPAGQAALGTYLIDDAKKLAKTLFDEYYKAKGSIDKAKTDFLAKDKTYAAGLPSPKLKYGLEENLAQGIISWKTHPQVEKALKDPKVAQAGTVYRTAPAGYMSDPNNRQGSIDSFNKMRNDAFKNSEEGLFKEFSTSKANPLKDEISRREYLKKKTVR